MAYENQEKCVRCGKPIPPMPEDADSDELLCDLCWCMNSIVEEVHDLCDDIRRLYDLFGAIRARIQGVWDNPVLMAFGPLHTDATVDVLRICEAAAEVFLAGGE